MQALQGTLSYVRLTKSRLVASAPGAQRNDDRSVLVEVCNLACWEVLDGIFR